MPARRTVVRMTIADRIRRPWVLDGLLALGALVAMLLITTQIDPGDGERSIDAMGYIVIGGAAAVLALRRTAPIVGLAVITVLLWVYTAREYAGGPIYLVFFIMAFAVAVSTERRRSLVIVATALAVLLSSHFLLFGFGDSVWPLLSVGWTAAAWFWGDGLRTRRAYLAGLEERARYLEETREEEARRRVADERLRIARDLHDVLAHSISSINVQAGVGLHVMDRAARAGPRVAHRDQGRRARRRSPSFDRPSGCCAGDERRAPRAPTPSLARLDPLLETAAHAGLAGRRRRPGRAAAVARRYRRRRLPDRAGVADERGAPRARAGQRRSRSTTGPHSWSSRSPTTGAAATARAGAPGHGIAGMRERAEAVGGHLEAGPRFPRRLPGMGPAADQRGDGLIRVAARRRPGARAGRIPGPARRRGRHRGGGRGRRRRRGGRGGAAHEARRRAHGHPHAGARRARGHPPDRRRRGQRRRCGC